MFTSSTFTGRLTMLLLRSTMLLRLKSPPLITFPRLMFPRSMFGVLGRLIPPLGRLNPPLGRLNPPDGRDTDGRAPPRDIPPPRMPPPPRIPPPPPRRCASTFVASVQSMTPHAKTQAALIV